MWVLKKVYEKFAESEGQFADFFFGKLGKVGTICRIRQTGFRQIVPYSGVYAQFAETQFAEFEGQFADFFGKLGFDKLSHISVEEDT